MKSKKEVQFCPRCGSINIISSKLIPLGDPLKMEGLLGWDCKDCGYTGKDFFIADKEDYERIYRKRFKKK